MMNYSSKHLGFVDKDETWNKIVSLYRDDEISIPTLAARFGLTNQAIRDVLIKRKVLRLKQRERCGDVGKAATANL
jgi:hypothetical protein